jgi:hypothetical protein
MCRKVTYLDRLNFWKRPRITIIYTICQYPHVWIDNISENERELQLFLQYSSIHIWLKLLLKYTLFQYDCIPSLTAVNMLAIFINNYFVEKVEAPVVLFSLYGFVWSFVIQNTQEKTSCSLLNRIFKFSLMRWMTCGQPNVPLCKNYLFKE